LQIDESSFTGEIKPAKKQNEVLAPNCTLSERSNVALMGTLVCSGRGKVIMHFITFLFEFFFISFFTFYCFLCTDSKFFLRFTVLKFKRDHK